LMAGLTEVLCYGTAVIAVPNDQPAPPTARRAS
jgi:hypothetical protein